MSDQETVRRKGLIVLRIIVALILLTLLGYAYNARSENSRLRVQIEGLHTKIARFEQEQAGLAEHTKRGWERYAQLRNECKAKERVPSKDERLASCVTEFVLTLIGSDGSRLPQ